MIYLASLVASHRLADELRAEQETAMLIERDRKLLECQVFLFALECQVVSGSRAHIVAGEGRTDQAGRSRADRAEGRQEGGRQDGDQDQRARVGAGFREQKVLLDSQCQLKAQY